MGMKTFIKATEYGLWDVIAERNYVPTKIVDGVKMPKEKHELNDDDKKLLLLNDKAINSSLEIAKEMWEALEVAHEGASGIKGNIVGMLKMEFDLFHMKEGESIRELEVRFSHLVNHLTALGVNYTQRDLVRKILDGFTREWDPKVTAIEEAKGESMRSITVLFGSLAKYESKQKYKNEVAQRNKKGIALKTKEDSEDKMEDEEMVS